MILSVSRRTDVPAFYLDWFLNRLKAGEVRVRNPFNPARVSRIALSPDTIECIAFWTKHPGPMLDRLDALAPYPYFVQYTLNPYGRKLEAYLPDLDRRVEIFKRLSERIGKNRVIWRYSPIVVSDRFTADFHRRHFAILAEQLSGYTEQCKLSFLEMYPKIAGRMHALGVADGDPEATLALARDLAGLARAANIAPAACGKPDLSAAGIELSGCIDAWLVQRLTGKAMILRKDPGQRRDGCRCVESIDIGAYQTCLNGCLYCYANHSHASARRKAAHYDPASALLCDAEKIDDRVTDRIIRIHRIEPPTSPLFGF